MATRSIPDKVGNFSQGTSNALFLKTYSITGEPQDVENVNITIIDSYSETLVNAEFATKAGDGYYYYEWNIATDAKIGEYSIVWNYISDGVSTNIYQSSIINDAPSSKNAYYGFVADMRNSLEYHLRAPMNIPIYFEEAKNLDNFSTYKLTFPRWNQSSGVKVYRNQELIRDGYSIDFFKGQIIFDSPNTEYDIINVDYNFRWFTDPQLMVFLNNGVQRINMYPPVSYHSLASLPSRFIPAVIYSAVVDGLREMMLSIQFQEPQLIFGSTEKAQSAFGNFDTLKKNYEESLKGMLDAKKVGPYAGLTRMVVVPEYTLPGGRSRYFRYLFTGSNI
jgi:hypothetical protein